MDVSPQPSPACGILRRLPIFDRKLETVAAELSFVDCDSEAPLDGARLKQGLQQLSGDSATAALGAAPIVVKIPASDLEGLLDTPWPLPSKILHIDTGDLPPSHWCDTLEALAQNGFEYILNQNAGPCERPLHPKLWRIANGVPAATGNAPSPLRSLWAPEIDTREAFQDLEANAAINWFSGEFWKRPVIQAPRSLPASQVGSLRLLAKLQNPEVDVNEVEQIISCDSTLSYKLLKLLNSAFFCSPSRVQSIHHGVHFFGLQRIKNWATVIVMNSVKFLPHEILPLGAYRAHLAEVLAQALHRPNAPQYYLVGLFSVLDALFDCKIEQLVAPLNLHDEIARALLAREGPAGELLNWVIGAENGRPVWTESLAPLRELDLIHIQLDAMSWTHDFCRCVGGD